MRTAQELFDISAKHLLTQGKQAATEAGECKYRGPDKTMCAVGCLIPEHEYHPLMEGSVIHLIRDGVLTPERLSEFQTHLELLRDLQRVHDTGRKPDEDGVGAPKFGPERWRECLAAVADKYGLSKAVLATKRYVGWVVKYINEIDGTDRGYRSLDIGDSTRTVYQTRAEAERVKATNPIGRRIFRVFVRVPA